MTLPLFYEADLRESGAIATLMACISAECHLEIATKASSGLPLDPQDTPTDQILAFKVVLHICPFTSGRHKLVGLTM